MTEKGVKRMYCSSCGLALARDLAYCNHCGARVNGSKDDRVIKAAELFPDSLIWAIVSVFVAGIGCVIDLMAVMKNYGLHHGAGRAISTPSCLPSSCSRRPFSLALFSPPKTCRPLAQ